MIQMNFHISCQYYWLVHCWREGQMQWGKRMSYWNIKKNLECTYLHRSLSGLWWGLNAIEAADVHSPETCKCKCSLCRPRSGSQWTIRYPSIPKTLWELWILEITCAQKCYWYSWNIDREWKHIFIHLLFPAVWSITPPKNVHLK